MNFSISKRVLYNALTTVVRAISPAAPVPSLSGVKIDVLTDRVILTGSDSNISIMTEIKESKADDPVQNELMILEEGSVVIDAKWIIEIVRKLCSDIITFETIDGTLTLIKGGSIEFKINGMRAIDYPRIDFTIDTPSFKMNTKMLSDIVKQTAFACSDKETRPALTGVNFKAKDNTLLCNATDSYRLATKKFNVEYPDTFNITIPAKTLSEIHNTVADELEFNMAISDTKLFVSTGNTIIRTRLIEDQYPDTTRLIPPSFTQELKIDAKELLNAVDRASFIKSDGKSVVKMTINQETMDISTSNQEVGSSHETLSVISFTGNPITISCSGNYLIDAIRAISTKEVTLSFSGELRPIIITSDEDKSLVQLVSPVRTYN